ncbi:hypothetical protein NQ314_014689, partial [Rhamnusium bicolor]
MSENVRRSMDSDSDTMAPAIAQQTYDANVDYVINEYMERLGTRLNILETELKYAWRALDLLSQEYIKMWERLEKLEGLLYEQQSVISQLLDFYTSGGASGGRNMGPATAAMLEGRLGELEVIREILGNGTVEDGLEEGLDVIMPHDQSAEIQELELDAAMDEMHVPDEAFYRSLNQAYREDLVGCDPSCQGSQLGMIWEEREEVDDNGEKKNELKDVDKAMRLDDSQEIYSALDYKDYRGDSPCISEQDIAQLSRIDSIDHVAIEKLNELDRLSNKLQQDSVNIKHLQRKLMESPISVSGIQEETLEGNQISESINIDEKLQQMYPEDNWSFTSGVRDKDELLLLAKSDLPSSLSNAAYSTRPNSRLSVTDTDNEVAETLAGGIRTPTSPRRRQIEVTSCNAPFTTVTGRLAYSAAVQHVESAEAAAAAAIAAHNPKNPFFCSSSDLNSLIAASYEAVPCSTPNIFSIRSEKAVSPTLSICSIRTRQDGYIGTDAQDICPSPSPPPPAPRDICEAFLLPNNPLVPCSGSSNVFLGTSEASSSINQEHGRLSPKPHSPKSPKTSPKRSKSHSSTIVAAKSDSGLSSMSGWSSLEKSPGSPKNGNTKAALNYYPDSKHSFNNRPISPNASAMQPNISMNSRPFTESSVDSRLVEPPQISSSCFLPGGHHLSAFTTVKSPCSLENLEGYGNFVPAPAPASDINVSPRKKPEQMSRENPISAAECMYRNDQPAIYSVAGSNRETYTSVYTSNSADYISQTINYPDLVEPYENNEFLNAQQRHFYNSLSSMPSTGVQVDPTHARRRSLSRSFSTSKGPESIANHEGYKTAMYRTMFPSGNITDALSYYPTSSRYDSAVANLPQGDYNDPATWLNCPPESQFHDSNSTSSSMRSIETSDTGYTQSPYMDRRHQHHPQHQNIQQPIYENQQQIDQHNRQWNQRQEIPYLELDLRNRNVPEYVVQQQHAPNKYYDSSGVIMTQSGYITISSGSNEQQCREEKPKKMKRGNTLKSAMTSVSHWLPDLHLTKRHRSYSLPSGSKKEDAESNRNVKSNVPVRKKKKNAIVSTVSGILQKAKRKGGHSQQYTQSLSDPEQSENEWTLNRTRSVVSEDDRSEDSCSVFSENQFDKENMFPKISTVKSKKSSNQADHKSDEEYQLQPVFESLSHTSDKTSSKTDTDAENGFGEEEHSGKSTGSGSSNIFPTVGEVKRSSGSSEKSDDTIITDNKMVVVVGGASMEFAVSRALGKYRQRQTNSISDDQLFSDEHGVVIEEIIEDTDNLIDETSSQISGKILPEQKSSDSQNSSESNKPILNDDSAVSEGSPSTISLRSHVNRFLPKHQQSLEIPGHRDDDDSRSTHSWRSTSRVSSRRQSTEDSIDSEDEWYCYELRKLEEMERQTQLEQDMGATLLEEPEPVEEELYEPAEEVVEGVLDEKDNNLHVIQSAKRRESNRGSFQLDNAAALFAKIKHYHHDDDYVEEQPPAQQVLEIEIPKDEEEHSSGETSGPDSPHHSTDEYDETEMMLNDEFARCHLNNEMDILAHGPIENGTEATETLSAVAIPKIQVDPSGTPNKEEPPKEGGQLGSKWKLLKTLKERKAEEKNHQGKPPVETPVEKDKNGTGIGGDSAGRAN